MAGPLTTDTPSAGLALDLLAFGIGAGAALAVALWRYPRMLAHAAWHPGCAH